MRSKLDGPGLLLLNGFFRRPDIEPLNPALTAVSSVLSPLLRRFCLLRCGLLLASLVSEVPGFLDVLLLRASQPSILDCAKAGHECREGCHRLRLLLAEVLGEPLVMDVMLKCR